MHQYRFVPTFALGFLFLLISCGKAEFHPDIDNSKQLTFLQFTGEETIETGELLGDLMLSGKRTVGVGKEFGVQFLERKEWIGKYRTAWFEIREEEQEAFRDFYGRSTGQNLVVWVNGEYFLASVYDPQQTVVDPLGNKIVVNGSITGMLIGILQRKN